MQFIQFIALTSKLCVKPIDFTIIRIFIQINIIIKTCLNIPVSYIHLLYSLIGFFNGLFCLTWKTVERRVVCATVQLKLALDSGFGEFKIFIKDLYGLTEKLFFNSVQQNYCYIVSLLLCQISLTLGIFTFYINFSLRPVMQPITASETLHYTMSMSQPTMKWPTQHCQRCLWNYNGFSFFLKHSKTNRVHQFLVLPILNLRNISNNYTLCIMLLDQ